MTTVVIALASLGVGWLLVRHLLLVRLNERRHAALGATQKTKALLFTKAEQFTWRLTFPVILSLSKDDLRILPAIPCLPVRTIHLLDVKKFGMDTFLPWRAPLDEGRVINVTLKSGCVLHFRVSEDIEGWRDWIQSYGIRA